MTRPLPGPRRLPARPLLDLADLMRREVDARPGRNHDHPTPAARMGVHPRTLQRWQTRGTVGVWTADRVCVRLGRHIDELWPEEAP